MSLKQLVTPKKLLPRDSLVRLGREKDGGYIINQHSIDLAVNCYTYGVCDEVSFEEDLLRRRFDFKIFMYDHTVHFTSPYPEFLKFKNEGLSADITGHTKDFLLHKLENKDLSNFSILKMDVEGCEFDYFLQTDLAALTRYVHCMIVEFHDLHKPKKFQKFMEVMPKINEYFHIIHIHGNNCGLSRIDVEGFTFPEAVEMTFVRKTTFDLKEENRVLYPLSIDRPNAEGLSDVAIDFR
jgi:hypothetical protein